MALDVGRNRIGVAVASRSSASVSPLEAVEYPHRQRACERNARATEELKTFMTRESDVRALLVGWRSSGRARGTALNLLDFLASESVLLRPFCLWNHDPTTDLRGDPFELMDDNDQQWGRWEDSLPRAPLDNEESWFRPGDSVEATRMLKAFVDAHYGESGEEWQVIEGGTTTREERVVEDAVVDEQEHSSFDARRRLLRRATLVV